MMVLSLFNRCIFHLYYSTCRCFFNFLTCVRLTLLLRPLGVPESYGRGFESRIALVMFVGLSGKRAFFRPFLKHNADVLM